MKIILLCQMLFLACIAFGCKSEAPASPVPFPPGEYVGTFSITYLVGSGDEYTVESAVTFVFTDASYRCAAEEVRYHPPTGCGTYGVYGCRNIVLTDTCAHTTEFDHTLILHGIFEFDFCENKLTLTQNDAQFDRYRRIILLKRD